jgi:hypothetical protein
MMLDHAAHASHASPLEWLLVCAAAVILVWSLAAAFRYTVRPGETDPGHIKHRILRDDEDEATEARAR